MSSHMWHWPRCISKPANSPWPSRRPRKHCGSNRTIPRRSSPGQGLPGQGRRRQGAGHFQDGHRPVPQDPAGYYYLGLGYRAQKQEGQALQAFEKALSLNPNLIDALSQVVGMYMSKKEPAKALARVRTQLHAAPQDPLLYNLLGGISLAQHNHTEAESALKKAIALNENVLVSYFNLAGLYAKNKAYAQAVQQYETVRKTQPNLLPPSMLLGTLHDLQHKPQQAIAYYEKALTLNPRFAPAANNLAWNYAEHGGNLDRALSLAHTAREQLPHDPSVADTLGWLYYKKDRYRQAIPLFKESAEKLADNPIVHYHLGMAYDKIGDTNLAKGALQRALHLRRDFPGAEAAQQVLTQIS